MDKKFSLKRGKYRFVCLIFTKVFHFLVDILGAVAKLIVVLP
jgi:hypothetical protein